MGVDKYRRSRFGKNFVSWVKKEKIGDTKYGENIYKREF